MPSFQRVRTSSHLATRSKRPQSYHLLDRPSRQSQMLAVPSAAYLWEETDNHKSLADRWYHFTNNDRAKGLWTRLDAQTAGIGT